MSMAHRAQVDRDRTLEELRCERGREPKELNQPLPAHEALATQPGVRYLLVLDASRGKRMLFVDVVSSDDELAVERRARDRVDERRVVEHRALDGEHRVFPEAGQR